MAGYQGWFMTPDDGGLDQWKHWSNTGKMPDPDNVHVAMWPDLREYDEDELYNTKFKSESNGGKLGLYSAYRQKTVVRHLKWMRDYQVDGVFVQRFLSAVKDFRGVRDKVLTNVRYGAEKHGRVFANMWDISGNLDESTLVKDIKNDWKHLVDDLSITDSPGYLHHNGYPVVSIWGFGFLDRPGTSDHALSLIDWFHSASDKKYRATVMGGVVTDWRDATDEWKDVYEAFDVVSPWTVGRMKNMDDVLDHRKNNWEKDKKRCDNKGMDYLPVVFPGFSLHNEDSQTRPFNVIPRLGGKFYWHQLHHVVKSGADMVYVAMFDEVDEATAIYKVAENDSQTPTKGKFVTLDQDNQGKCVPSDWYLTLTGIATQYIRAGMQLPQTMPDILSGACDWSDSDNDDDDDNGYIGNGGGGGGGWILPLVQFFVDFILNVVDNN